MIALLATSALTCLPLDDWRGALADVGRVETVRAMVGPDLMLLVFVAPDGTFTVFQVTPDMVACLVAGGTNWSMVKPGVTG
jgi:hypothetical protein